MANVWRLRSQRGISLLEVMIGVAIVVGVAASVTLVGSKSIRAMTNFKTSNIAGQLGSTKMEDVKRHPYTLVPLTDYGPWFTTLDCDCSKVNFSHPSFPNTEKIPWGTIVYTLQACVHRVEQAGSTWVSRCPNALETGFRKILVRTSWKIGNEAKSFDLESMVSLSTGNVSTGNFIINVCRATEPFDPESPCDTAPLAQASVQGSSVAAYSDSELQTTVVNPPSPATLAVRAPGTYTIHVQKEGFFPFRMENVVLNEGQTITVSPNPIPLRSISYFASRYGGEVFLSTTPVIAKAVAAFRVDSCVQDLTEALEIYNPTNQTYTIPGTLTVGFWTAADPATSPHVSGPSTPNYLRQPDFTNGQFFCSPSGNPCTMLAPVSLVPGGSLLLMGVNDVANPTVNPWSIQPDIWYDANQLLLDFIPHDESAGGIQILTSNGGADSLRWIGDHEDPALNAQPTSTLPGTTWEGDGLLAGKLGPAAFGPSGVCTSNTQTLRVPARASRRGQIPSTGGNFSSTGAPGAWGQAYDTNLNRLNFGSWATVDIYNPAARIPLRNTASVILQTPSGMPARLAFADQTFIQVGDPASSRRLAIIPYGAGDYRYTSQLKVDSIFGSEGSEGASAVPAGGWPVMVVAGPYMEQTTTPHVFQTPWTLISTIPFVGAPPQPCQGGSCDTNTSQYTIPWTADPRPPYVDYGSYPDSKTPYIKLTSTSTGWGFITGIVRESGTLLPLWGVPVSISNGAGFSVEKITDEVGDFVILCPNTVLDIRVNNRQPLASNPSPSHFYHPHHRSWTSLGYNPAFASPGAIRNLGTISLPVQLPGTGSNSISGSLQAAENSAALSFRTMELRDDRGNLIRTTESNGTGQYVFGSVLSDRTYYVKPALDRQWSAVPPEVRINLGTVPATAPAILIRGVQATVIQYSPLPGQLVLLTPGPYNNPLPPTMDQTTAATSLTYTGVTAPAYGGSDRVVLKVRPGHSYHVVCWGLNTSGTFVRNPASGSTSLNEGNVLQPGVTYNVGDGCFL